MNVFLCKSGFYGILCGVYDAYVSGFDAEDCRLEMEDEYEPSLFCTYHTSGRVIWKAEKTAAAVRRRLPEEAYVWLYRASLHKSPERAESIRRFIYLGLREGAAVLHRMQDAAVYEVFSMNRSVMNEAHLLTGFVRYKRLNSGVLYGKIGPENDVLELVAGHFADRLPGENWILYDEKRNKSAVHEREGKWIVAEGTDRENMRELEQKGGGDSYAELWKAFFHSIAVEERKNPQCQKNLLPLRYRSYMTEFQ